MVVEPQGARGGLLSLLQLADSCFPAGGFAFSNGLEGLAKTGRLRGMEDFLQYLECYLEQAACAELPFLNSAFPLASAPGGVAAPEAASPGGPLSDVPPFGAVPAPMGAAPFGAAFAEVAWEWDAFLSLPAPRRASLAQGQAWLRAMEGAYGDDPVLGPALLSLRPRFRELEAPAHFLMALSAGLRVAGFPLEEAQSLLLHMALRDQLGAAVRLGLVGSLQAQGIHRRFASRAEALRRRHAARPHHLSRKTAPMIEMGQAGHPYLYSRLFQS